METAAAATPRPRCAETTAAALLDAAAARFARHGYENTSVRDIAADAGVNPALIYRYFGSKEKLFVKVVSRDRDPAAIIAGPLDELPDRSVTWFRNRPPAIAGEHPLALMLRSAGREGVADLMRAQVRDTVGTLADRLEGPEAELRAAVILALNVGIGALASVAGVDVLSDAPPERLRAHLAAAMLPLIEAAHDDATPGDTASGDTVLDGTAPDDAAPDDAAPDDTTSDDTTSGDKAPDDKVFGGKALDA